MWKNILIFMLLALLSWSIVGCGGGGSTAEQAVVETTTSTTVMVTTTTLAPVINGAITGIVTLEGYADSSGVNISIQGTSISTLSASTGNYIIDNVPIGIYTVICSKLSFESESIGNITIEAEKIAAINFYLISTTPPPPPF